MGDLSPLLAVRNMKKTIEFYTTTLGFKLGMVFPNTENPEYADLSKDGMVLMVIPAMELKQNNVSFTEDIKDEPFGVRDFTIEDPDGYRLTFTEVTARQCLSCGMPMKSHDDFGGGNPANLYCIHCSNRDGSLKTYDEVLDGMMNLMMQTQGIPRDAAKAEAEKYLAGMPAWNGENLS